jgi:hypothetical protein
MGANKITESSNLNRRRQKRWPLLHTREGYEYSDAMVALLEMVNCVGGGTMKCAAQCIEIENVV